MDADHLALSRDDRCVSKHTIFRFGDSTKLVISKEATDDFTVRMSSPPNARFPAHGMVGFITRTALKNDATSISGPPIQPGMYVLHAKYGRLWGSGLRDKRYYKDADGITHATVRCVCDRAPGTISFEVDGKRHGVAWRKVCC